MTDPVNPIAPLVAPTIQPYQSYLPTAFSDDLSLLQKMNYLISFMQTVTTTVNNFSNTINSDVDAQLNTWLNDGTLSTLINQTLLGSRAGITVSATAPTSPDTETYWFKVV